MQDATFRVGAPEFELSSTPLGAPEAPVGWHVSKTHTEGFAAAAISRAPIGIDAEWIHRPRLRAAKECASPEELALLGAVNDANAATVVLLWTGKEAVLKKLGLGLTGISRCRLIASSGAGELLFEFEGIRHEVVSQRIGDYWLSICCLEDVLPVRVKLEETPA